MVLTVEEFVGIHSEFAPLAVSNRVTVQTALDDAAADTDADVCGAQTNKVIRLKACHELALSAFGRRAQLVDDEGNTPYLTTLNTLTQNLGLAHGTAASCD